jgi:phosphoribosyl 1,2-cyclic phosphodiesterase
MRVWLLSSGSSGNLAVIEAGAARLLVDAGIGPKACVERMRKLGGDLFGSSRPVAGIVVTHHHADHIGRLEPLVRALRVPIFLHSGVSASRIRARYTVRPYPRDGSFSVGPFRIRSVSVPHDAPQVALSVASGGLRFGVATDVGKVTPPLVDLLSECDEALVEANYCPELLENGPYVARLKKRVGGDLGHLSNDQTAALAAELGRTRLARLWLGHISLDNNSAQRALSCIRPWAKGIAVEVVPHGAARLLDVRRGHGAMRQLALEFAG